MISAAHASHRKRFPENSSRGFCQAILHEFTLGGERDIGDVASGVSFAANSFAKIIHDDEMKSRFGFFILWN